MKHKRVISGEGYRGIRCPEDYRPLKSVYGEVVGFTCIHCGRLATADHLPLCKAIASPSGQEESSK